jgi:hypothetical protein
MIGANMATPKTAGGIVGILILAQIGAGIVVNFVLAAPLSGSGGFLINAAMHPVQIASSVLLGMLTASMLVGIVITVFPLLRRNAGGMALWLLALASVSLAVAVFEQISVMSMLSLSEAHSRAGVAERESLQALRVVVASARNWSHYVGLIIVGSTIFIFYTALFRLKLVPRALAAFGMAAAALQVIAVSMPLFGISIVFLLLAPLGVSQLVLALWLITKGFDQAVE